MKLALRRVAEFTSAGGDFDPELAVDGYSIDSRTIRPGELFFAVTGERFDGHDFVEAALEAGGAAAVVSGRKAGRYAQRKRLLLVEEPLSALQALGAAARRLWGKTLVAVTGSIGKTTTKEATAQVLARRFRVLKSEGNLNNHFGLPLQLLRLEPEHEMAVVELGMSHAGEIAMLAKMAAPDIGVVTNVAPVHLEFFASLAEIARAKYELVASLPAGATAVLNADDEYVSQFGRDFHGRVVTFGVQRPAEVRGEALEMGGAEGARFDLVSGGCRQRVTLGLPGVHNVYNALAAAAVGLERNLQPSEVAAALAGLRPGERRGETLQLAGATVINDCYNSNPKALEAMVSWLAALPARRRIVVAGEMLELGAAAPELHRLAGQHMAQQGVDWVIGVRGAAQQIVEAARAAGLRAEFVATPEEAARRLERELRPGDAVLLKASRGVQLEKALEVLQASARQTEAGDQLSAISTPRES